MEMQQFKIQIEQGAQPHRRDDGANAHLSAQEPACHNHGNLHRGTADPHRPSGLAGQRHHQGISGAGAQGSPHIEPGTDDQDLQPSHQHEQAAPQCLHPGNPVQGQQAVNKECAENDVQDCTQPDGFPAQQGHRHYHGPHNHRCGAIGDAEGVGHALLKDAPWFQADVGLEHHHDPHGADHHAQDDIGNAPHISGCHVGSPSRQRQPHLPQSTKPKLR